MGKEKNLLSGRDGRMAGVRVFGPTHQFYMYLFSIHF